MPPSDTKAGRPKTRLTRTFATRTPGTPRSSKSISTPTVVPYETLVRVFFENHDPTTKNRQGPDIGDQYRSAIFFHSPEQKAVAEKVKSELDAAGRFRRPIVTEVVPAQTFYRGEEYHQRYLEKHGRVSCHI